MNKFTYIGFYCITLLCSCTNENKESTLHIYDKFPQTKELYATPVAIDSTLFRYPFRIRVTGDRAIVFDLHNADYFFHLFTYPDFHYLSSFGKLGDSPQEMISADNIRFKNDKECWALDGNKEKWFVYRFSEKRDSMLLSFVVPIDRRIQRALDFVFINDLVLLVPDYTGKHRFCLLNTKGCLLYSQGRIPTTKGQALSESTQAFAQAWRSFVDYRPQIHTVGFVTQLGEVIELYGKKAYQHIVEKGPKGDPNSKFHKKEVINKNILMKNKIIYSPIFTCIYSTKKNN